MQQPKPTSSPLIEVTHLIREFPAGEQTIRVLDNINLTIYDGELVAIIGQSGSGKSTLMNILGCLDKPTAGSYKIFGKATNTLDADELARLRREHFGFIFQKYHLLGDIDATHNVAVPAVYAGVPVQQRTKRAQYLLNQLGLADKFTNKPNQLSGGQQQRVSIARALMNGGDIILADEPTGALDSQSGKDVIAILRELNAQGHTVIMVTHDPKVAATANRLIEIKDGRILQDTQNIANPQPQQADINQPNTCDATFASKQQGKPAILDSKTEVTNGDTRFEKQQKKSNAVVAFFDRLRESFIMALLAMNAHRMRTLLTMLGIIIGIASVVSVVALGKGSQQKILADISDLGTNTITVIDGYDWGDPRRRRGVQALTPDDALAVASQPYVQSVSPQLDSNAKVRYRNLEVDASIAGVGLDYLDVSGETLSQGQGFDNASLTQMAQDVIIDDNARVALFSTEANPLGKVLLLGKVPVRVIGVLAKKNNTGMFGNSDTPSIYMPYTTMMSRIKGTRFIERFVVRLKPEVSSSAADNAIKQLIQQRHGDDNFRTMSSDAIKQTIESTTATMTLLISSIAVISLIVGGIGVMNIMLVSVTERTNEIGVRMAVGARQSDIMQQFLIEAVLVCLLGGALGVGLSFAIGAIIMQFAGSTVAVMYSTGSIIAAFVCSSLIGILFGFLPARNAARLDPVYALARE